MLRTIAVGAVGAAVIFTAAARIRQRNERIAQALAGIADHPTQPSDPIARSAASTQSEPSESAAATALVEVATDLLAAAPTGATLTSPRAVAES